MRTRGAEAAMNESLMAANYFLRFNHRMPPRFAPMTPLGNALWHGLAGITIGLAVWYLFWRWTASLNPDAMAFSVVVAGAETAAFLGTVLFFFDIWGERDTRKQAPPSNRSDVHLFGTGVVSVDVFITTYDEGVDLVHATIIDACAMRAPPGCVINIFILDDGRQVGMRELAMSFGVGYLERSDNVGFKAGNLRNALIQTRGDFVVICDADTRVLPSFLVNTLGYFRDPRVGWVQTPHWFYDIPEGRQIAELEWLPAWARDALGRMLPNRRVGADPFMSDASVFFDVIQRRRNRHNASFCCGAGSIHRREAIFDDAILRFSREAGKIAKQVGREVSISHARAVEFQPFCFHVSEDILTSIHQHSAGWKSVFHPKVEARMLSPWSIEAWATQRLKYAGGTFDIMLRANALFLRGMPWRVRLHYAATFWSYLSTIWLPVLLFAPVVSLITGIAPVEAYSLEFFLHLVPLLLVNEAAMAIGCKGYDTHGGRALAISALPIQVRAAIQVCRGQRPRFPTTPKVPGMQRDWRYACPAICLLMIMFAAGIWGTFATWTGREGFSNSLLVANLFWMSWNSLALVRVLQMCLWLPPSRQSQIGKVQLKSDAEGNSRAHSF